MGGPRFLSNRHNLLRCAERDRPSLYFLYFALQTHDLGSLSADSAVPGLNRNMAYMSEQLLPPNDIIVKFDNLVRPLFDLIESLKNQAVSIGSTRDSLLPKLLSGEVRVPVDGQLEVVG